ncbi:MAG: hypothetical protein WC538_15360 [Thermoanaerobaculia bacterium]|jgi:hypothetical protein
MKNAIAIGLISVALAGCASTSMKSAWKDPEMSSVDIAGKKVVTVLVSEKRAARLGAEDAVARYLNSLGAQATPSFQVLAPESTKEEAKAKLQGDGFDAAVVMRVTDKAQEIYSTPGVYSPAMYGGYYGRGWGYGMAYGTGPEIRTDTKIYVETLVYSLKADKLVWAGVTETTNPANVEKFATEVATIAIDSMKKSGAIK